MADLEQRLANLTPLQRAVLALKETQQRLEALERQRDEPIALVGLACRFPGGANDARSYWRLLCDGTNAIREIPAERWEASAYYDPDPAAPGKMNSRWGGFVDKIDEFDNHFFGMSDREAMRLDPQHRMSLELTWEALEDAGIPPSSLRGSRTGVFVGLSHSEYGIMLSTDMAQTDAYVGTGTAHCLVANRVSFTYDFHGPSVMLDTACSSSLVAVHLACQSIRTGESEMAIAGGVNIILSPLASVNLTKAGFSSGDGQVRAFDAAASGYVRSEGGGLVVLKPLSAALRDGDRIYAVIRGSAVNQNGFSNGLTAPSRAAQQRVLRQAYAAARLPVGQVQYVEAQGTGTRLGDAIEALALGEVLADGRAAGNLCAIGSVKTNIGHLEAASGAASLIKVALALHHGQIPRTLNYQSPNPDIPFAQLPLRVQDQQSLWPASPTGRLAGVSAFGFGGSNAHVVLTDAPAAATTVATTATPTPLWLTLSARTDTALQALVRRYVDFLHDRTAPAWADVCHTAAVRRDHHDCRLALSATSAGQAAEILERYLSNPSQAKLVTGRKPFGRDSKVVLAYGPWDAARSGELRASLARLPGWSDSVAEIDRLVSGAVETSLSQALADETVWTDPRRRAAAVTALQLALTHWLRQAGVIPSIVVGSGLGLVATAATAGILSAGDAVRIASALGGGARAAGQWPRSAAAQIPCLSATGGAVPAGADGTLEAWQRATTASADWSSTLTALRQRQVEVVLAVGEAVPGSSPNLPVVAVATGDPATPADEAVRAAFGPLYCAGVSVQWKRLTSGGRPAAIPTYPWQKHRLWIDRKDWLAHAAGRVGQNGESDNGHAAPKVNGRTAHPAAPSGEPAVSERRIRPELNTPFEPPRTPLEADLVHAWCEILKIDRVGIHDNFFELGGDSLQAMILHNALQDRLGEVVLGYVLFQAQTVDSLASYLRRYYAAAVRRLHADEPFSDAECATPEPTTVGPAEVEQVQQLMARLSPLPQFAQPTKPKNRRAVFVFSPPRSGSTLLRVMLAGHPRLFSPPELELLSFPTLAARRDAYAGVPGQWLEGVIRTVMEVHHCDVDEARRIVAQYEDEGRSVHEFYGWIQDQIGDRLLVDKTPGYSARVEFMQQAEALFDQPLYVQLLRHPCGMMRSYVEYQMHEALKVRFVGGMQLPFTPYQLAELTWIIAHRNIQEFFRDIPGERQFLLRFEDVVRQPEATMRGFCDFLGLEYAEEMIHPYDHRDKKMLDGVVAQDRMYGDQKFLVKHKSIDPSVADEWRKHISADILGSVARDMAYQLGYSDVRAESGPASTTTSATAATGVRLATARGRGDQAAELLGRLDELSDAEVELLLQEQLANESGHD